MKPIIFLVLATIVMITQVSAQTQTLEIPGAGPHVALLRFLAVEFNLAHPNASILIPESVGVMDALAAVSGGARLARLPRRLSVDEKSQGLRETVIARQAVAFVAGSKVAIAGLTRQQFADAFSGKVSNWSAVGGDVAPIRVVYRHDGTESLRMIRGRLPEFAKIQFTSAGRLVHLNSDVPLVMQRFAWSLGWMSLDTARAATGLRVLTLDGVMPSLATLKSGQYPLFLEVVLVHSGRLTGLGEQFVAFATSPAGRAAIERAGALPVVDP